jgi:hypothetical protein
MSANVQNILHNLEAVPPPGAWDLINSRLDAEYDPQEIKIAEKLYDWETTPPPAAWTQIALAIQVDAVQEPTPARVIQLPFRKLAIAAVTLAVVGFATWAFLNRASGDVIVQQDPTVNTPTNIAPADKDVTVQPSLPVLDASIGNSGRRPNINVARRVNAAAALPASYISNELSDEATDDIQYAEMDGLHALETTSRKGIKAPPIKDASGNIIMDPNLIVSRDKNYIIITCPNGEQARLSTKFLPLLADLNATADPAEYLGSFLWEKSIWKNRFSQWRYKLMQQASFAPTATNFLDIMALKDLIEDK